MGKGIISNMWVYPVPYLPEPGACLQLYCAGSRELQSTASNTYALVKSLGIKNEDAGILERWMEILDDGFGEDWRCWVGTEMGQSDWERLVKDNL